MVVVISKINDMWGVRIYFGSEILQAGHGRLGEERQDTSARGLVMHMDLFFRV